MSQQSTAQKPSLQGVRIKARKGAVKAQAKHEPTGERSSSIEKKNQYFNVNFINKVFRDQLYKHLENVPEGDFDAFSTKLIQAGSTLEYLKYADTLFEIILVGGLLQPGGSYYDDGAPVSPFTIFNAKEPAEIEDLKKYVDVLNKLIRRCNHNSSICLSITYLSARYKYLQKPLEDSALPGILQYIHRWTPAQKDKLALTTGLLIAQGLANGAVLQSLMKDHLIKNGAFRKDFAVSLQA